MKRVLCFLFPLLLLFSSSIADNSVIFEGQQVLVTDMSYSFPLFDKSNSILDIASSDDSFGATFSAASDGSVSHLLVKAQESGSYAVTVSSGNYEAVLPFRVLDASSIVKQPSLLQPAPLQVIINKPELSFAIAFQTLQDNLSEFSLINLPCYALTSRSGDVDTGYMMESCFFIPRSNDSWYALSYIPYDYGDMLDVAEFIASGSGESLTVNIDDFISKSLSMEYYITCDVLDGVSEDMLIRTLEQEYGCTLTDKPFDDFFEGQSRYIFSSVKMDRIMEFVEMHNTAT